MANQGGDDPGAKAMPLVGGREHKVMPRLPVFSIDDKDTAFNLWEFEVQCLVAEDQHEADIKLSIRGSLAEVARSCSAD
jgi:hypothetical protein